MKITRGLALGVALAALAAGPAVAHPGHGPAIFAVGLGHPFSGLDHLLAMTAVGLWAARRGGAAIVAWPCAFVAAMLAGYGLGLGQAELSLIEPPIWASVIVLGALTAADVRAPFVLGVALIGVCGLAHGFAHGVEAPAGSGAGFPAGFALATASLHLIGLGLGSLFMKLNRPQWLRILGGGVMLGGLIAAVG